MNPADFENRYTSAQACEAAGISTVTLKNWIGRHAPAILLTKAERENVGKGRPLLLSFNRIMQIALVAELVGLGFQPRPAAMAAVAYTDLSSSEGASGWRADEDEGLPEHPALPARMPGQLFPSGLTYLVVPRGANSETKVNGKCINVTTDMPAHELLDGVFAAAVVDVSALHRRVRSVLGH
jgi:hypothetical protein